MDLRKIGYTDVKWLRSWC